MKLDPLFTVNKNQLCNISDNSPVDLSSLKVIELSWSKIEIEEESYNEEFLAQLRDELKAMDDQNKFAILVPVADKKLESAEDFELFTNAFNHTARRIKDCVSVTGYALPKELLAKGLGDGSPVQDFVETLAIKHAQYVYFIKKETIQQLSLTDDAALEQFVLW